MRSRSVGIAALVAGAFAAVHALAADGPAAVPDAAGSRRAPRPLWAHVPPDGKGLTCRGLKARFVSRNGRRSLRISQTAISLPLGESVPDPRRSVAWVSVPAPSRGWPLHTTRYVEATVRNIGTETPLVTLWAVGSRGSAAVGDGRLIGPGGEHTLRCDLREQYPDGTFKVDPGGLAEIRIMVQRVLHADLEVTGLRASGTASPWQPPPGRLLVPEPTEGPPQPGRRVWFRLPGETGDVYGTLYLPADWSEERRFPVIAEFPGNLFFDARKCWSTGRPEQCVIGYGITRGRGAIWLSLPFVDRAAGTIAESGFGSNDGDDTAEYTVHAIDAICRQWNGERNNVVLCGFSRGAIACGYIGLRNDRIAPLWRAFVACQHYDGSGWRQSTMEGAVARAGRFRGCAIVQIDNDPRKYAPVVRATPRDVRWTWERSGLGSHATAMFLDDRPMMQRLREWYRHLCQR